MKGFQKAILILFGSAVGAWIAWRIASRRRSLPCPAWLGWLLENPITESISGTKILDYLALEPGMKVLDMGCGPGRLSVPAAARVGPGGEVVGVDIQEAMLRRAREKAIAAGGENIKFLLAGAGEGKLAQEYFDRAMLVTVLGEIPDRDAALVEIYRALKPGGWLAVAEVFPDPHYQRQTKVRELAQNAGFKEAKTYGSGLAYTMILARPNDA